MIKSANSFTILQQHKDGNYDDVTYHVSFRRDGPDYLVIYDGQPIGKVERTSRTVGRQFASGVYVGTPTQRTMWRPRPDNDDYKYARVAKPRRIEAAESVLRAHLNIPYV